jgi:hypothetical protein
MTSCDEVNPILSDEAVEGLAVLVTAAASKEAERNVVNAQVSEEYFKLKVLPQHICSPSTKDAVSCFTVDRWESLRQAWLDGQPAEIRLWYRESFADIPDNPALGFAKIHGGSETEDHIQCNKPNHAFIKKNSTTEIYNGKRRYEAFLEHKQNALKEECAREGISLEEAYERDENYVLANATITTEKHGTLSINDHMAAKSETLKVNVKVKNAVDLLTKLMTSAVGNQGGSETDDNGGALFDEALEVSTEQIAAFEDLRDQLVSFDATMKEEPLSEEQIEQRGNYIPS